MSYRQRLRKPRQGTPRSLQTCQPCPFSVTNKERRLNEASATSFPFPCCKGDDVSGVSFRNQENKTHYDLFLSVVCLELLKITLQCLLPSHWAVRETMLINHAKSLTGQGGKPCGTSLLAGRSSRLGHGQVHPEIAFCFVSEEI